jgi:hypothetical protein
MNDSRASRARWIAAAIAFLAWTAVVGAWLARALPMALDVGPLAVRSDHFYGVIFGVAGAWGLLAMIRAKRSPAVATFFAASVGYLYVWVAAVFFLDLFDQPYLRTACGELGPFFAFFIGLAWIVWYVERRWSAHVREEGSDLRRDEGDRIWDPFHPRAWYYGRTAAKLNQSLAVVTTYAALFVALFMLSGKLTGCTEVYELPGGGGEQQTVTQQVKIQKVIKKKFVINPFSAIIFNPPPIDSVQLNLKEITAHLHKIGQGEGDGAGYEGGTSTGKVRFIRLQYTGGDWDQDMGLGLDLNMLIQYGVRTGQKVAEETESRTIAALDNFPIGKSPPLMYMTGQKQISLSKSEIRTLREYLYDKHGMLFIDNGGSSTFHNQVFQMMRQVAPEVEPVRVPLDDVIHRVPNALHSVPIVAAHGGKDAWGWKVDGRWIAYYHPGDIGDAWSDGHSGVRTEVWEACYQLGVNVINYAHAEYSRWLKTQAGAKKP